MDSFSHNFLLHNYYSINLWKNLPCTQKSRPSWLSFAAGMDGDTEWTALFETLIGSWADNVYFCVYLDKIKALEIVMISRAFAWSRWQDLNLRPFGPEILRFAFYVLSCRQCYKKETLQKDTIWHGKTYSVAVSLQLNREFNALAGIQSAMLEKQSIKLSKLYIKFYKM